MFFISCLLVARLAALSALSIDETLSALSNISQNDKARFRWDPMFQTGAFYLGSHNGTFFVAEREGQTGFLLINNRELFDVPMPYGDNGNLVFPEAFVETLKNTFTRLRENDASRFRVAAIVIDPGHGGRDAGAAGNKIINGKTTAVYEKDVVLKTALLLKELLTSAYPDKRVLMTRETDTYLTLDQRADMANAVNVADNEAVIFISIHANWGANSNARGFEVWHITSGYRRKLINPSGNNFPTDITAILNAMLEEEYTTESILLTNFILSNLGETFGDSLPSRGPKANDWFVVRNSRMPAVLVELGFLSNKQDMELMTSDEGLRKFSHSLYNGVKDFIGIFER